MGAGCAREMAQGAATGVRSRVAYAGVPGHGQRPHNRQACPAACPGESARREPQPTSRSGRQSARNNATLRRQDSSLECGSPLPLLGKGRRPGHLLRAFRAATRQQDRSEFHLDPSSTSLYNRFQPDMSQWLQKYPVNSAQNSWKSPSCDSWSFASAGRFRTP